MNAFQIISELYRILGQSEIAEIEQARRIAGSDSLKAVLNAMAICVRVAAPHPHQTPSRERFAGGLPLLPSSEWQLEQLLKESRRSLSTRELAVVLRRAGLPSARPKEGSARILRRAAASLDHMTPERQARILSALRQLLDVDQTAGWMKVARDPK